jgi:hypothetical protein
MQTNERSYLLSDDLGSKEWVGIVVDANDPELMGRCKVRVYGIFDTLPDEHLPWSFPAANNTFAGGEGGYAFISVPKIGSLVKIKFANGDRYSPQYLGLININPDVQEEISGTYEGSHVLLYDVDEDMKIFYTPGKGLRIALLQSNLTINPDKSITIEHADSKSIIELNGENINVTSQTEVKVTSQKVIIDHTDTVELGAGAVERLVLGDTFLTLFNSHTHLGNMGLPTSPPVIPMTPAQHLSGKTAKPVVKTL